MNENLHVVQLNILAELVFNNGSRFSDLNKTGLPNDHFVFHLKRLVDLEFIYKKEEKYYLSTLGKKFANKIDTENLKIEDFGLISVMCICNKIENNQKLYLMQRRLKEPYYGHYGFITGKVRMGDSTYETAKRELKEETGLTGNPKSLGVMHIIENKQDKELLLDAYFACYLFENPKGKLINTREGENTWMTEEDILKIDKTWHNFIETRFKMAKNGAYSPYQEIINTIEDF